MTTTVFLVVLLAVILPLVLYVWEGWRDRPARELADPADPEVDHDHAEVLEFFAAGRSLSVGQYATTTVAYGLQMASVVLFVQWGYYYGYWAFLVPLAWCIGFLLLAWFAARLESFLRGAWTLHGYLGDSHGNSLMLVRVAGIATLLGLGGALFAELGYTAAIVQNLLGRSDLFRYMLMFFFLASVLVYVLPGGFRAVVQTDSRQLPMGYIGLAVLLAAIVYVGRGLGVNTVPAMVIGVVCFATITLTSVAGIATAEHRPGARRLVSVVVPVVSLALIVGAYFLGSLSPSTLSDKVQEVKAWAPEPMGLLTAASLLAANALWQLVDLSAFQRLTAIRLPPDPPSKTAILRKAILWTALESPISWSIGIAIGIGLGHLGVFGGPDGAWTAHEVFLTSVATGSGVGGGLPEVVRAAVVGVSLAGMIAIMLSSVDSLGSAVSFTTMSDLLGKSRIKTGSKKSAQIVTMTVLLIAWGAFALWQGVLSSEHDISGWLYTAYAMQLSLFGVSMCALLSVSLSPWVASASVVLGVLASAATGTYLAIKGDPDVFAWPPIVAVSVSLLIVLWPLVRGISRRRA